MAVEFAVLGLRMLVGLLIDTFQAISFVVGYFQQSFAATFYGWAAGCVLAGIMCIPDYPWYNSQRLEWLDSVPQGKDYDENWTAGIGSAPNKPRK